MTGRVPLFTRPALQGRAVHGTVHTGVAGQALRTAFAVDDLPDDWKAAIRKLDQH